MRSRWIVGTVLAVALLAGGFLYLATPRGGGSLQKAQTTSGNILRAQPTAHDRFTQIRRQVTAPQEFDAELQETIYYQGPVSVRIAWRKPDFVFVHVGRFEDNPRIWYWYESQKLCIYEEWPRRGGRGVCVTNIVDVAGDTEQAFALVLNKCGAFAQFGFLGICAIKLLEEARSDRLEIIDGGKEWRCTAPEDSFAVDSIKPFLPGTDDRTLVTFLLPKEAHSTAGLAKILIEHQDPNPEKRLAIPREAGVVIEINALRSSVDRTQLPAPNPPEGSIKTVEIHDAEGLRPEIIESVRPIAVPENR